MKENHEKLSFHFLKKNNNYSLHILLFLITFISCMIAGAQWAFKDYTNVMNWHYGLTYAILIMTFLTAHEFGHYFAAKLHKVDATLPYYIPFPIPGFVNFGTFGAVIKTRSPILSRKALFDIGIAGPIAGFVVSLIFLIYGFATLPGIDFIYHLHPEYLTLYAGQIPKTNLHFGDTALYWILAKVFANPNGFLPPMNEIYHYPFLNVGWFGLFVTSLNMLPMGQLDGGHIIYAMFGKIHSKIARIFWYFLLLLGFFGLLGLLYDMLSMTYADSIVIFIQDTLMPILSWIRYNAPWIMNSWLGWLFWAIITKFFIKLDHPPVHDNSDLGVLRKTLGWFAILILILSFAYNGIYIIE